MAWPPPEGGADPAPLPPGLLPVAVDVMSGDRTPADYVAGAFSALETDPQLAAVLVGDAAVLAAALGSAPRALRERLRVIPATQVVAMDESPREAVRRKRASSMRIAIDLVRRRAARACVSAGNTGALHAMAHFVLRCLPGIERAAMVSAIPAAHGCIHMLDLGANTRASPRQLSQFAAMGAEVARARVPGREPRIGLLNIGEEATKGSELVREAHALIAASGLEYVGFIEGDRILTGAVDVVVTDGFTGNVALKTMEGVAALIAQELRKQASNSLAARCAGLAARPLLRRMGSVLDPRAYNGACMVGLTGTVVKSHGRADSRAFASAVLTAAQAVRLELPERIARAVCEGRAPV